LRSIALYIEEEKREIQAEKRGRERHVFNMARKKEREERGGCKRSDQKILKAKGKTFNWKKGHWISLDMSNKLKQEDERGAGKKKSELRRGGSALS